MSPSGPQGEERYPEVSLPSVLPLPNPPFTPEGTVLYLTQLHNILAQNQTRVAEAVRVLSYLRNTVGLDTDKTTWPVAPVGGVAGMPPATGSNVEHVQVDRVTGEARFFVDVLTSGGTPTWYQVGTSAAHVDVDTSNFDGALSSADDTVQKALDTIDDGLGDVQDFFNGTFVESFDALITSDGATITMSLEQSGTGNLTMRFSDGDTTLDCTPADTIALTAGTASSPQANYIYIPQATKVLTKSTTQWPSAEHIKVGYFFVQTAALVASDGALINQNWNDHRMDTSNQGHLAHLCEAIRLTMGGADWHSGVGPDGDAGTYLVITGTPDEVYFKSTAGVAFQMHKHTVPAWNMQTGDDCHVVNWSGDAYHEISDLALIVDDSTGSTLNNKYYNLVFWGTANKTGEYSPLMCNVPAGSYNTLSAAEADSGNYDVTTIPEEFVGESTIGFLICRITCRQSSGTWTVHATKDLRGVSVGSSGGAGAGGSVLTEFPDSQFLVYDSDDVTRILNFDLAGITTGNTRTITPADAAMTLFSTAQYTDLTDGGDTTLHKHDAYLPLAGGTMTGAIYMDGNNLYFGDGTGTGSSGTIFCPSGFTMRYWTGATWAGYFTVYPSTSLGIGQPGPGGNMVTKLYSGTDDVEFDAGWSCPPASTATDYTQVDNSTGDLNQYGDALIDTEATVNADLGLISKGWFGNRTKTMSNNTSQNFFKWGTGAVDGDAMKYRVDFVLHVEYTVLSTTYYWNRGGYLEGLLTHTGNVYGNSAAGVVWTDNGSSRSAAGASHTPTMNETVVQGGAGTGSSAGPYFFVNLTSGTYVSGSCEYSVQFSDTNDDKITLF